jgi:hypothetical protein
MSIALSNIMFTAQTSHFEQWLVSQSVESLSNCGCSPHLRTRLIGVASFEQVIASVRISQNAWPRN